MVDLSIIIVSWNTVKLLRECLESIYGHTKGITFEVFVVDNASSDGSSDMVKESFPGVRLIENSQNAGFSKANNQAIVLSEGRHIALLNPDTLLIEDVFSKLVNYADQHDNVGAIGPKLLNRDGKTIQYVCARRLPSLFDSVCYNSGLSGRFPGSRLLNRTNMTYWDHRSSRYVEVISGACMVVRRKTVDGVGLMDENQFMYADDVDWCKRIMDAGWRVYYCSEASILHYGGESSKQARALTKLSSVKSTWYYYQKHNGRTYAYIYALQIALFSVCKYAVAMLPGRDADGTLKKVHSNNLLWSVRRLSWSDRE
jgi:GT2 family glycosyltransferase